ncbi:MAG: ATP-binding domain-containing protein [Polyangiaceae bacterium]
MRVGLAYRAGDKVMQLRNDYERDVYNGDVGTIESVDADKRVLRVRVDDRLVEYDDQSLEDLSLAYAISIHKSQGSEYPAVVIPWQKHHFVMLSRKLLYTAVTRGKRLVVLVADPYALKLGLADERKGVRRTGLAGRL